MLALVPCFSAKLRPCQRVASLTPLCPQKEQLFHQPCRPEQALVPLEGLSAFSGVLFPRLRHSQGPCPVPKGTEATAESEGAVPPPGPHQCCPAQPLHPVTLGDALGWPGLTPTPHSHSLAAFPGDGERVEMVKWRKLVG